jgi:hypothetical protein
MCLIIRKPPGRSLCAEFLENAWSRNSDGWGSFHLDRGQPVRTIGMDFATLAEHNLRLPRHQEIFLHLRKATYGRVCPEMAHPYEVRDGLMLMHNGSIHHLAPQDPCRSDTAELAHSLRDMLSGLTQAQAAALLRSEGFSRLMAPLIKGSMVILMDEQGAVRLGRDWHVVQAHEWGGAMPGIEVSNTHAWAPKCTAAASGWAAAAQRLRAWWSAQPGLGGLN